MPDNPQFQILHISDLHIKKKENFDRSAVLDPLIRRVKIDRDSGFSPEVVVVTGDIAFSGKKEEYEGAKIFFDDLLAALELPDERLFIVPGNHDLNRKKYKKSDVPAYASMQDLNDDLENEEFRPDILKGMSAYFEFIETHYPHLASLGDRLVPFVISHETAGDKRVGLVGLNSAWMCRKSEGDKGRIAIGEFQLKKAVEELEKSAPLDLKIFLFHHPLNFLWPRDRKICRTFLNQTILLTGHLHDTEGGFFQDYDGELHQFQAGGAYLGSESDWPARFQYDH